MADILDRKKLLELLQSFVKRNTVELPTGSVKSVFGIPREDVEKLADAIIVLSEPCLSERWR